MLLSQIRKSGNIAAVFGVMLLGAMAVADSITLRASVRLDSDRSEIRLADIAVLHGEEAKRYAETVIAAVPESDEPMEISLRAVRSALEEAGVHWGRVNLNGRRVVVRPRSRGLASVPMAMQDVSIEPAETSRATSRPESRSARSAAELIDEPNVHGLVASMISRGLRVEPDALRLDFDRRDEELLNTGTDGDLRYEVEPVSGVHGERIDLVIRKWMDGRIIDRKTIRVAPTVRQSVVVVAEDVERGAFIRETDLELVEQWLPPQSAGRVNSAEKAVGRKAGQRLRAGDVLRTQHLYRETLVRRGARVNVRCLVGGAVIMLHAEARADGVDGERIEFRKFGERETFLATVTGPNEAVVELSR